MVDWLKKNRTGKRHSGLYIRLIVVMERRNRGQTMEKRRYRSGIPSIIHSAVDKYGTEYCQHFPVRYCCYMECERCKEIAWERSGTLQVINEQGMTKERLLAYRSNRQEIKELEYILNNRWKSDLFVGNDTIFDYSKGYPRPQSVVGFDQERYERLQDRDLHRKSELEEECRMIEDYVGGIKDSMTRRIFQVYFTDGLSNVTQENVAKRMNIERSYVSKKINDYLQHSHYSQKSQL